MEIIMILVLIPQLLRLHVHLPPLTLPAQKYCLFNFLGVVVLTVVLLANDLDEHTADFSNCEFGGEGVEFEG